MVFGLSSKSRYLCIDVQFDQLYFVVVRQVGNFFEIDFNEKLVFEGGVFEDSRFRAPGKIADILFLVKKKFGVIPVLVSIPEDFSYATLLPTEIYPTSLDIQRTISSLVLSPSYVWAHTFKKNKQSFTSLHSSEKKICDALYALVKTTGLNTITIYPRALIFAELEKSEDIVVCEFGVGRTNLFSTHASHTANFSSVSYGVDELYKKIKSKFSLSDQEVVEVLAAYGTEVLPRKEGHVVHGIIHNFLVPIIDEIHSLQVRRVEQGLEPIAYLAALGDLAQYSGIIEDIARMTRIEVRLSNVWNDSIDFNTYIPGIHKNDSYAYAGIGALIGILKNGTRYEPFDL